MNWPTELLSMFRALRSRNYRLFFMGQGASLVGTWIQQTAEVWLAYRLTHSALALGVVGFASQIPIFLLTPIAGGWIDRSNKHRILIWTQVAAMVQALILAALTLTGSVTYVQLIVLSVIGGVIDAVDIPARQSFLIQMVEEREDLPNAIALNSSLMNGARLLGPSMAGLLIGWVGEGWCFSINGVSFLAVLIALLVMRVKPVPAPDLRHSLATVLREGLTYVVGSTPIATLLTLLAFTSFVVSVYTVLLPIFATQILHGGAHTLGFLMAGSGAGALTAALYLASRRTIVGLGRVILFGIGTLGSALILFSFSHWFALSWILLYGVGFGMMVSTASMNTMIQTIVEEDKRARVMSFFAMAFIGMAPLGNLAGGSVANHLGAPATVCTAGFLCLAGGLWFWKRLPAVREHIRPIYRRLGIIPEVAKGLEAAASVPSLKPEK